MRVSVFAPHPDDETIGCGGCILKHARSGNEVAVHYLTSGDAGNLRYTRADLGAIREKEAMAATRALGVVRVDFLRQPDSLLTENAELLGAIVNSIRDWRPHLVYLPHEHDDHHDHIAAHRLVLKAVNIAAGPWLPESAGQPWTVRTILGYEVWSPISRPGYLEDTTEFIDRQLSVIDNYASQLDDIPYEQFILGLNRYRGARLGRGRTAEAFQVLRMSASVTGSD